MNLTRKRLIRSIATDTGISQKKSSEILIVLLNAITGSVACGDYVLLRKFGKLHVVEKKARRIRHPQTGKYIFLTKRKVVKFKCSDCLKDLLNEEISDDPFFEANREHLQKLYDIAQTNHRILDKKDIKNVDLRGADLSEASLAMVDLAHVNLSNAHLFETDLQESNLQGAVLDGATIMWANLKGVNLYKASLQYADLRWTNLEGADLTKANLRCANLTGANLEGAKLSDADLHGIELKNSDLDHADLKDSKLDITKKFKRVTAFLFRFK